MKELHSNHINLEEHRQSEEIDPPLSQEEIVILQRDYKAKVEIVPKLNGKYTIKASEYVGYIVLPNHIINIKPKIKGINFVNMVRYALDMPVVGEHDYISEEAENFYDILVLFLLKKCGDLLKRGLYNSYIDYQENINCVRGKILFEGHVITNNGRNDRIYCQFSELTADVLENRIIKYTLHHLLQLEFLEKRIRAELVALYKRFDQVELTPVSSDMIEFVNYTPLNEHYKSAISLCELLLRDSSLDILRIGQKTSVSFLIDMNMLFQNFVGKLLQERLGPRVVKLQKWRYPEMQNRRLRVQPDIIISRKGRSSMVLDTKYKEIKDKPDESEVAQMVLYSVSTGLKNCVLVYTGKSRLQNFALKEGINLHTLSLDLNIQNWSGFESICSECVHTISSL